MFLNISKRYCILARISSDIGSACQVSDGHMLDTARDAVGAADCEPPADASPDTKGAGARMTDRADALRDWVTGGGVARKTTASAKTESGRSSSTSRSPRPAAGLQRPESAKIPPIAIALSRLSEFDKSIYVYLRIRDDYCDNLPPKYSLM
jgi:hypothetical protein